MFRRHRRHSDKPSVLGMLHEMTHIEIGRALEHWIILAEKVLIAGEEIVLPQMLGSPCATIWPHSIISAIHRSGNTPQIGVVVGHPSLCPIKHLGCFGTCSGKVVDKREQWIVTFREICHFGRPIVHLGIDIDGVFTVPRGIHTAIPHSLQVGCLSSWL